MLSASSSAFARVSDGVAFNADRILFGTPLDGSAPININTVKQLEGGVKWRSGGLSTFVTLFQANEPAGAQTVFHFHIHVLPRWDGDGIESRKLRWTLGELGAGVIPLVHEHLAELAPPRGLKEVGGHAGLNGIDRFDAQHERHGRLQLEPVERRLRPLVERSFRRAFAELEPPFCRIWRRARQPGEIIVGELRHFRNRVVSAGAVRPPPSLLATPPTFAITWQPQRLQPCRQQRQWHCEHLRSRGHL